MAIKLTCACGQRMAVEKQNIGRKVACPGCGKHLLLDRAKLIAFARRSGGSRSSSLAASTPSSAARHPVPAELDDEVFKTDGDDLLGLLDDDAINAQLAAIPNTTKPSIGRGGTHLDRDLVEADSSAMGERPICPSCGNSLPPRSKLCVQCGIDIKTGRSMVTSTDGHLDAAYENAEKIIWWVSWLIGFGVYPIASEAYGGRKPHFVRGIALATILISAFIWYHEWTDSPKMHSYKQLMLWSGNKPPDAETIENLYFVTEWGDNEAFEARLNEAVAEKQRVAKEAALASEKSRGSGAKGVKQAAAGGARKNSANEAGAKTSEEDAEDSESTTQATDADSESSDDEDEVDEISDDEWEMREALAPEVHAALPIEARTVGEYRHYQLLTNAFLHSDPLHLIGNLLFLFVLGSRVNALIGNAWCALVYPLLAIFGSMGHAISMSDQETHPAIGASGAIMGLAGMYLVLFPVHKVHMARWIRWLFTGYRLSMKIWAVRGFWVVLFYIAFDVVSTALGVDDGVAHWAHLGGFIGGVALALILIVTRRINARGADLVSAILGKRAWAIVGKPRA